MDPRAKRWKGRLSANVKLHIAVLRLTPLTDSEVSAMAKEVTEGIFELEGSINCRDIYPW